MRVLVISHMYPTIASPLGGIFVQKQAEALAARGTEVTVVHPTPYVPAVFRFFPRWGHYARIPRRETVNGIEVRHPRVLEFPRGYFFDWYPKTYIRGMKRTLAGLIKTKNRISFTPMWPILTGRRQSISERSTASLSL